MKLREALIQKKQDEESKNDLIDHKDDLENRLAKSYNKIESLKSENIELKSENIELKSENIELKSERDSYKKKCKKPKSPRKETPRKPRIPRAPKKYPIEENKEDQPVEFQKKIELESYTTESEIVISGMIQNSEEAAIEEDGSNESEEEDGQRELHPQ
ncbi:unnamed protein product [Moneuplotes crassus]|uniref:Uncharacterized protein n=1 Tax=Euplotes crassus TaxID=5936 RepID=A0AAD2D5B4_EUPCR|nr:unnamed protein product [Moneuplotes crassus]